MTTQSIAKTEETRLQPRQYQDNHGNDLMLTLDAVRKLFNVPKATDEEIALFIRVCEGHKLNPFLREAYLIKYDTNAASIVVGKDVFTQRAASHPQFDGFSAGIIVQRGDKLVYETGAFCLPSDKVVGGWFEGKRKDWSAPFKHQVPIQEYDKGQSTWRQMKATMIRKVALCQGLREMFPERFVGLYDPSEMREVGITQEGEPIEIKAEVRALEDRVIEILENANPDNWGICPVHDVPWVERNGRNGAFFSHGLEEGGFCSIAKTLKQWAFEKYEYTDQQVNDLCKLLFGVPSSGISKEQMEEVYSEIIDRYTRANTSEIEEEDDATNSSEVS